MRVLLLVSLPALALAATASAEPDAAPETATPSPAAEATPAVPTPAVPKKTPSPPSTKAKPKADAKKSPAEMRKISDSYLKQCLQDWDSATHMTRREWERTCRRVVQARAKFMLEQMGK